MPAILDVRNLDTRFATPEGQVHAVNDISFHIAPGESVGVVGESGSGKTQIFLSIMGLLAKNGRASGSVRYRDKEILGLPARELNKVPGVTMSLIFQDPMTSLNTYLLLSAQLHGVRLDQKGMEEGKAPHRATSQ